MNHGMHKVHTRKIRLTKPYAIAAIIASLVAIGIIIALLVTNHHPKGSSDPISVTPISSTTQTPVAVTQPPSAADVAKSLNCGSFADGGPSELGGVTDSGNCYIGAKKYAIDTFASKQVRDAWLPTAEGLGVVPKWETDTSVTYLSVAS